MSPESANFEWLRRLHGYCILVVEFGQSGTDDNDATP